MRRRRMAYVAAALAVAAMGLERATNLCAMASFDPFPDWTYLGAYLLVPLSLVYSERALSRLAAGLPGSVLSGTLALIGGTCAALIALTACFMLLPLVGLALRYAPLGAGLAWLSPYAALAVLIAQLAALGSELPSELLGRARLLSLVCAMLLATAIIGRQVAAGYLIAQAMRPDARSEQAVQALRALRAGNYLLPLLHGYSLPYWVAVGRGRWADLVVPSNQSWRYWSVPMDQEMRAARELFFRVTGQTADSVPLPDLVHHASGRGSLRIHPHSEQIGGGEVGRPTKALSLVGSRMTGRILRDAELVELRWVLVLRNFGSTPEEARAEVNLPEGATVTDASLWAAGRERRAIFARWAGGGTEPQPAGASESRYLLLLTQPSPDKTFLQCYPILAGSFARISLNLEVPMRWREADGRCLEFVPPRFRQANFMFGPGAKHEISLIGRWSRSDCTIREGAWTSRAGPRARRGLAGGRLAATHVAAEPYASIEPLRLDTAMSPKAGDVLPGGQVRLRDPLAPLARPIALTLVLDPVEAVAGSASELQEEVRAALGRLHPESPVVLLRGDQPARPIAQRRAGEPEALLKAIDQALQAPSAGGLDPLQGLLRAIRSTSAAGLPGAVVWLHGPIPDGVSHPRALAGLLRAPEAPALVGVLFGNGPDAFMDALAGEPLTAALWRAPGSRHTLEDAFVQAGLLALEREESPGLISSGGRAGSLDGFAFTVAGETLAVGHSRLIRALALQAWYGERGDHGGQRLEEAVRMACAGRVLTPLSAALVPEKEADIQRASQPPLVQRQGIIPEPGPVAALLAAALAWLAVRFRRGWAR